MNARKILIPHRRVERALHKKVIVVSQNIIIEVAEIYRFSISLLLPLVRDYQDLKSNQNRIASETL